jgi:tight adherence protein B
MTWYIIAIISILTGMTVFTLALPLAERVSWIIRLRIATDSRKFAAWGSSLYLQYAGHRYRLLAISLIVCVATLPLICLLMTDRIVLAIITGVVVWLSPVGIYMILRERILDQIEADLPSAVDTMVASVRAGRSLQQAIQDLASKTSGPLGFEFNLISIEQSRTGLSLEDALTRARDRVNLESFTLVTSALIISLSSGGDLLSILERIAESLRELFKLRKKLKTETAQIRMQEKVLIAMTPLFCGLVCSFDEEIPIILFDTIPGNLLLAIVTGIQFFSIFWIRRIIRATI